ncbi:class I SAM-dependent methyltransferase [Candidatus Poribacteria bacterium]|nr:class I SAM-dependent methyltransferase [Candidatus Poribacteria bacterium]
MKGNNSEARYYPKSKVELHGFMAYHYDLMLDIVTLGGYPPFIRRVIGLMGIEPKDRILDLGAGTGRNACLMMGYLSSEGELIGVDISDEMISQFLRKCADFPNARIVKARIDRPLPFKGGFDKAFISFTLHGFPQEVREEIIRNAFEMLRDGGTLFILDYNEFNLREMPLYLRIPFKLVECPYAFDFLRRDWRGILADNGFGEFEEHIFFKYVRLLKAKKRRVDGGKDRKGGLVPSDEGLRRGTSVRLRNG